MKPTIDMIASKCGVSKVTVSRVIANNPNVNAKTREHILDVMSQLNYRPKKMVELMSSRQNAIICVLVEDFSRRSSLDVIRSVKEYLSTEGYFCIAHEYEQSTLQQTLEMLQSFCAGCIIIAGNENPETLFASNPTLNIPITLIHWNLGWSQIDSVIENTYQCAYMMINYLTTLGHKRIALVNSPSHASGHYDTEAGYMSALRQCGLEIDTRIILESDLTQKGGAAAGKAILGVQPKISAAICTNTAVARGVLQSIQDAGIQVPQQFSVMACGLSNTDSSECGLNISVVGAKYQEMGVAAAENLLGRIREKNTSPGAVKGAIRKLILDPVLHEGSTTAAIAQHP